MNDNHQNTEGYRQHAELRNKGLLRMNKLGEQRHKKHNGFGIEQRHQYSLTKPLTGGRHRYIGRRERLIQRAGHRAKELYTQIDQIGRPNPLDYQQRQLRGGNNHANAAGSNNRYDAHPHRHPNNPRHRITQIIIQRVSQRQEYTGAGTGNGQAGDQYIKVELLH